MCSSGFLFFKKEREDSAKSRLFISTSPCHWVCERLVHCQGDFFFTHDSIWYGPDYMLPHMPLQMFSQLGVLSPVSQHQMKLADSVMAGKASDGSIKWQLCYDISARTWWMVSWQPGLLFFFFFFFSLFYFPSLFDKMSQTSHSSNSHLIFFTLFSEAASHCFLLPSSLCHSAT